MARLRHERFTSPRVGELLAKVESSDLVRDPESDAGANVREARRDYDRATKIPASISSKRSPRPACWRSTPGSKRARTSKFKTFEPWLAKTVDLKKREAQCVGWKDHIYDALLDPYEPGETTANLRRVFDSLRDPLIELIGKISTSGKRAPVEVLARQFPDASSGTLWTNRRRGDRIRLQRRTIGHHGASVLLRDRRRGYAHHHAIQHQELRRIIHGRAARNGPRALRAGPAQGGSFRRADRRGDLAGDSRDRNRACGRISSAGENRSGDSSAQKPARCLGPHCARSMRTRGTSR